MAIGKSPPRNRKAAARPQDHAPASLAASRSRAAPRLAAPKSKGRNSKSTNASPLTVDIPTTPFLANFLSPLDVAATQQVSMTFIRLRSSSEKLLFCNVARSKQDTSARLLLHAQEGLQRGSKSPRSTATSPKRSVREVTVPRSPKVESQLYTSWTPLQSPNAASPTKLVGTTFCLTTLCVLNTGFCAAAKLRDMNRRILKALAQMQLCVHT